MAVKHPTLSRPLEAGGNAFDTPPLLKAEDGGEGDARRLLMAIITAPHGVKGLVRVKSFAADPDALRSYPLVTGEGARVELAIVGAAKGVLLARLKGVEDRTHAESWKGVRLYVERSALPAPEDDEYYHADLLGLAAELKDGTVLGRVCAIHDYGAGETIEIERAEGAPLVVPFTRAAVPVIDLVHGRILIEPPEGLL